MFAEAPKKRKLDEDEDEDEDEGFGYGISNGTLCRLPIPPSKCKVFLPNCDPETLKRALRRIAELLRLSDPDDPPPAFRSLHIHLKVDYYKKPDFDLLQQLFAVLAPYMVELTLSSYKPSLSRYLGSPYSPYGPQLLTVLVDYCLVRSPKLTTIRLYYCKLDAYAGLKLGDLLRGHTTNDWCLLELDMQRCELVEPSCSFFEELRLAMAACPPERRRLARIYLLNFEGPWMDFQGRLVESDCIFEFLQFCAKCPRLKSLIVNPSIDSWVFRRHGGGLRAGMPRLKILDFSFTSCFSELSDTDAAEFFDAVVRHRGLETLRLCNILLSSAHLQPLTRCLEACRKLHRLHLSGNRRLLPDDDQAHSNPLVQDFVSVVSRLPALQELTPPKFANCRILDLLFQSLIQNKSPLRVLRINELTLPLPVEDSWVRWIPHLRLSYLHVKVRADDPGWPQLSRALRQNTYLTGSYVREAPLEVLRMTDFSMKDECFWWQENLQAVYQHNTLVSQIRRRSDGLRLSSPSHWSILLQGLVNHKVLPSAKDHTPLFLFLRYNVDEFVVGCCGVDQHQTNSNKKQKKNDKTTCSS